MKARLGLVLATATLLAGSGCAAGGGGGPEGPAAAPSFPGAQGEVLAEGIRPRDNSFTRQAETMLNQGMGATDDAEKAEAYQAALAAAMEGIAADPENPKSYFQAGMANVSLKDFFGADSMFTKAQDLHPRYQLEIDPWREQGWVEAYNEAIGPLNAGDLDAALSFFEAADALYSQRPEAILQLGSLYSRLGRHAESADAFRRAIALLDDSREVAMMDTLQAPEWENQWEIASMGLGVALQSSEQYPEAAEHYGMMLEADPSNAAILGSLASVLTEMEMPDSVDALYENLLNRPGLTEFDYANAGVGLYRIEQYDRAAEAFRRAADLNPLGRDARLNLAQTLFIAEKWEEVIPAARDLLELDPLNGFTWVYIVRSLSELERTEEANEVFQEYQALGYELETLELQGLPTGGARVSGTFKNNSAEAGSTVTLKFFFGGESGREIGNIDIRIQVPAAEETVEFSGEFETRDSVTGYRYEVVG